MAKRVVCGILLCAVALTGCDRKSNDVPPPRATNTIVFKPRASLLTVPIVGDASGIGPALDREIPRVLWTVDKPDQKCVPSKKVKVAFVKLKTPTIECDIVGEVTRGRLRFSGQGDNIDLAMPITANVQARDIGGILKHETATARAVAHARINLDFAPDWTLRGKVDMRYDWIDSPHMEFLGRRIDFTEAVDSKLAPMIAKLEKRLEAELSRLEVRPKIEHAWRSAFTSVELNRRNPPVWMRITPQELQYGGYTFTGNSLQLRLGLKALTETYVGDRPADPPHTPLPPLSPLSGEAGKLAFFIPVIADYEELEPVLMKALVKRSKRPFVLTDNAAVLTEFHKVTIYGTTGGKIAVGVNFTAKGATGKLGPATGTVWLTGKPVNAHNSRKVGFTEFHVSGSTGVTGNDLLMQIANRPEMAATIADALGQNFENDYQKLLTKIDRAIGNRQEGRLDIRADVTEIQTGTIRAAGQGLFLPVWAHGTASVGVMKR